MSYRKIPLVPGEIYHVYNRSIARQPIFLTNRHFLRMNELIPFYIHSKPPLRFSHYDRLNKEKKDMFFTSLTLNNYHQVEILAYCIMPNHVHFLIKELEPGGISKFMSNIQNSFAKFFNLKHDRSGGLFQEMFKAVHIDTDEQLIHICRYIHLNPFTSFVVRSLDDLERYIWSSLPIYLGKPSPFVHTDMIMKFFASRDAFKQFTFDQGDYQRELDKIKHLILED